MGRGSVFCSVFFFFFLHFYRVFSFFGGFSVVFLFVFSLGWATGFGTCSKVRSRFT